MNHIFLQELCEIEFVGSPMYGAVLEQYDTAIHLCVVILKHGFPW